MRTLTINGKDFELKKATMHNEGGYGLNHFSCGGRDLYSVYTNPSSNKRAIWRQWYLWACGTNLHTDGHINNFGVNTGNSYTFSIMGIYRDANGKKYGLKITASHNVAWEF